MKSIIYKLLLLSILFTYGCDPIEDKLLREKFENAGSPITQAELDAALSVTQPIQNADDKRLNNFLTLRHRHAKVRRCIFNKPASDFGQQFFCALLFCNCSANRVALWV